MKYKNIQKGFFLSRINRFTAKILINDAEEICHVKNTGRCKELFIPGVGVYVEKSDNPDRKTKFDLISLYKNNNLINVDSQAPNKVVKEYLEKGQFIKNISLIKPEYTYKKSRFDFYVESGNRKIFIEVKGVTLENNGVVKFPDAPTLRGVKHLNELCECIKDGYEAFVIFVIQMENAIYFTPNGDTDPEFAKALNKAISSGVNINCFSCTVTEDELKIKESVPFKTE